MALLIAVLGITTLVGLIALGRLHPFLAFLLVSLATGLALGLSPAVLLEAIQTGISATLGSILGIIALGAMLGKLVAQSGAAQRIATSLLTLVGIKNIRWAFLVTGFLVGLPLFYSVGFLLLAPIVITLASRYKLSAVYVGLPMLASLSVTQGYLPPHPAPLAILRQFNADLGLTLLYGIIIAIPAVLISGMWFGARLNRYTTPPNQSFVIQEMEDRQMPSIGVSFLTVLLPIGLIGLNVLLSPWLAEGSVIKALLVLAGDPLMSLLISVLVALFVLGQARTKGMAKVTDLLTGSVNEVSLLFLVFAGAGAFKQVLLVGGVSQSIAELMQASWLPPYVLGWGVAAIIRVCIGSSTVSGITTAGFVMPLLKQPGVDANLMVLSIGAGSMMFSHVNDTGFWLFREYFKLSMSDTLKTWSVMETLVSLTGLAGVMALSRLVD